jgi:hypothetical protein
MEMSPSGIYLRSGKSFSLSRIEFGVTVRSEAACPPDVAPSTLEVDQVAQPLAADKIIAAVINEADLLIIIFPWLLK